VFFHSDQDPTLVIQMPDGSYLCNDDAHEGLLDSTITIEKPPAGKYNMGAFLKPDVLCGQRSRREFK